MQQPLKEDGVLVAEDCTVGDVIMGWLFGCGPAMATVKLMGSWGCRFVPEETSMLRLNLLG